MDYDIQFVGGLKKAFFGGEGLFFASLTGPGKVWLQTLPFGRLAARIGHNVGGGRGEGGLLGKIGRIFGGN